MKLSRHAVHAAQAIVRKKREVEQQLRGAISSIWGPTGRWLGPLLLEVPPSGACTATVAGLKLVCPCYWVCLLKHALR